MTKYHLYHDDQHPERTAAWLRKIININKKTGQRLVSVQEYQRGQKAIRLSSAERRLTMLPSNYVSTLPPCLEIELIFDKA